MLFCTCILIRVFCHSRIAIWDINKSCTYRILSISAIEKEIQEKSLVSFFYALRPTGFRGCSTDRCRWQKKEGDAGEKSGVPQTERREGERTTRFRGGQGRFKSCLRNQKERYKRKRDTRENLVSFFMPCDRRGFYRFRNWKKETQ